MDAHFLAELNERLFVHFVQDKWRAPLGARLLPVRAYDGDRGGQIVCADRADVARAFDSVPSQAAPDLAAMRAAFEAGVDELCDLRAHEGLATSLEGPSAPTLPEGPTVLLSAAQAPIGTLLALIGAGVQQGHMIWKPAPRAAGSAHYLMTQIADHAAGRLAFVQGDHQTGQALGQAALGRDGGVIWLSATPPPQGLRALWVNPDPSA